MSAINRIIVGPDNTLTAIGNDEDDIPASIVAPVAGDADVEVGLEFSLISSLPVIWITTESHANADVFFNDEWVLKVIDGALVPITDEDRNGNRPVAVKPEESADETARKIIATWTAGLITLAEMVAELQKVADVEHHKALAAGAEIAARRKSSRSCTCDDSDVYDGYAECSVHPRPTGQ